MSSSGSYHPSPYPGLVRPVIWTLGVIVAIFIVYEIVERLWLQELNSQTVHLLHLLRGLSTSLIAAVLAGWLIFKYSPSLFSSSMATVKLPQIERPADLERLDNFNRWFISMRWIAVIVALILTFLTVLVAEWLPQEVFRPLLLTIGSLVVLNLAYEFVFRKGYLKEHLLTFQAYTDLVILVILLHFSGGIENPLSLLMLFHVIIAGIVLNKQHCYAVAASASVLLTLVASGEASGILNHYTLTIFPHVIHDGELAHASHQPFYVISHVGLLTVIFFLTAYFVTTLADRIRHSELQLEKFADHALEQRRLIEKALESTYTGLCVCNNADPYWTNKRWEFWFGKQSFDAIAAKYQLNERAPICRSLKDGKTRVSEITLPEETSREVSGIIRITSAPILDKEGRCDQVVSLAQDVTEQKKVQKQLIRAGKLAAVGELAGHVAHEVNNPIGIISAKCRLLLGDHSDEITPKVRQELEKIIGAADRVAHIAKGLLSYCRPSTAKRTELDISTPILEAMTMIGERANKLGVDIEDKLPDNLPSVNANTDEIQQVFLNLFLNALDAMPDGGMIQVTGSITESSGDDTDNRLEIGIQDSGTGIPGDIQDQIFEPFFTTKDESKGTGLGLSICAGLIRSHGGTIEVESEPGQGTRITVCLPVIDKKTEISS